MVLLVACFAQHVIRCCWHRVYPYGSMSHHCATCHAHHHSSHTSNVTSKVTLSVEPWTLGTGIDACCQRFMLCMLCRSVRGWLAGCD